MSSSAGRGASRIGVLLYLDVCLLAGFCVLQAPQGTGTVVHEWLGVAFAAAVLAHLLLNWTWIAATLRRLFTGEARRARINAGLNAALFVFMIFATFSGFMISEVVLPLAGISPSPPLPWRKVHNQFATLSILVVGLHLGLNWDWISAAVRAVFRRRNAVKTDGAPEPSLSVGAAAAQRTLLTTAGRLVAICIAAAAVSTVCLAIVGSDRAASSNASSARTVEGARRPERARLPSLPRQVALPLSVVGIGALFGKRFFHL